MNALEVFDVIERNKILRWKDLSFKVLTHTLELPLIFHKSVVLAGGVYTSWYHEEKIKDVDVFILNTVDKGDIIDYISSVKIQDMFEKNSFKDTSEYKRDNGNILSVFNAVHEKTRVKLQFIYTNYKTREELIEHFDFLHCTPNYYDGKLYVRRDAFESVRDKKLVVHNEKNQVQWRREKFLSRGFTENTSSNPIPWYI
jgi:hypothetical protein